MEDQDILQREEKGYEPRPAWQIWCARIGVVIMIIAFLGYCWQIANAGGLG